MMLQMKRVAFGQDAPVATTAAGKVSGRVENGIYVFRGIPYGEDTRKTRFKAPMPVAAWSGVKECVEWSTRTPQLTPDRGVGGERVGFHLPLDKGEQSEDCLHVNVWTPGLRDGKKRAVLFYIHGGAYNNGTANCDLYDGNRLCHRGDVVVVTVNHRLNAFGYMYLGELGGKEYAGFGECGDAGSCSRVEVGAEEYCGVWRGRFAGADLRTVGGRSEVRDADGDAGGEGTVSSRVDDERATGDGETHSNCECSDEGCSG